MTTTTSPPIVSIQAPKDVSIEQIEAELRQIWESYNQEDGQAATRAATFSLIVFEPDPVQQLLTALGFYSGPVDGISGPRTAAAVEEAQKAYDLEVTGKITPEFKEKLEAEFTKAKAEGKLSSEAAYAPDARAAGLADAIAAISPCRIITLCVTSGEDEGVEAQVSAYCPIQKQKQSNLVCCEYITLRGTAPALERVGGIISALTIGDLPKFLWWKATPEPDYGLFKRLAKDCDRVIVDSSNFNAPETDLLQIGQLLESSVSMADLNWGRLAAWQELTAEAFDPPERRSAILEVDRVTIDYEKGNISQAIMYLGWLASRLQWSPVSFDRQEQDGGGYDIAKVKFTTADERGEIEAELAGVPVADAGDILGDLTSLRLSSTNLDADCCTVLCSETTGCMRMEAGGGAQSCRIQQVTPLFDQRTDRLLGEELQRWSSDALYEESMGLAAQILDLAKN
ncbi:MAG: glucose-6-phosphate dehydrogenase assembly protein OpcA [Prochloraceae cyanobacterium]